MVTEAKINELEQQITNLQQEIKEIKTELDLHWESHLRKQREIEQLQEKKHQEVLQKQEDGFFKQKIMWIGGFSGLIIAGIVAFIAVIKKLKEAKQEIKELLKK